MQKKVIKYSISAVIILLIVYNSVYFKKLSVVKAENSTYEFDAADFKTWKQQYKANVIEDHSFSMTGKSKNRSEKQEADIFGSDGFEDMSAFTSQDLLGEIDAMEPMERQFFMDELAVRSDFWDEESGVFYE